LSGNRSKQREVGIAVSCVLAAVLAACGGSASSAETRTVQLATLNDSGVSGTVSLTDAGGGLTRVVVAVVPGANPDMPAHIHPGSCDNLVPQPKYPLQNVVNGSSTTTVPAPLGELMAGDLAVNLHRSNQDLATYTACADLR
jgi:hypothetical protein